MADSNLIEALATVAWLANIGQPDENAEIFGSFEDILEALATDPDAFFEWRDTGSYEGLCVADHMAAAELETAETDPQVAAVAKQAYERAWARVPDRRLCELVSDDAQTIMLLLLGGKPLSPFTAERLNWYRAGRVPWGYAGAYPNGRWMIL
jgi:hypothetical protein